MAVVALQGVDEGVVVVQDDPLAVLCGGACTGGPISTISERHVRLTAQRVVLRAVGHPGDVPSRAWIQPVRLTNHVEQVPVSAIAERSCGAEHQSKSIVTVGEVLPSGIRTVEQALRRPTGAQS